MRIENLSAIGNTSYFVNRDLATLAHGNLNHLHLISFKIIRVAHTLKPTLRRLAPACKLCSPIQHCQGSWIVGQKFSSEFKGIMTTCVCHFIETTLQSKCVVRASNGTPSSRWDLNVRGHKVHLEVGNDISLRQIRCAIWQIVAIKHANGDDPVISVFFKPRRRHLPASADCRPNQFNVQPFRYPPGVQAELHVHQKRRTIKIVTGVFLTCPCDLHRFSQSHGGHQRSSNEIVL